MNAARVMIVDDEPMITKYMIRSLREFEVVSFNEARRALDALANGADYSLILCDLNMPDVTGVELFEAAVACRPELRERFVFMSGGATSAELERFLEEFRDQRIDKPFEAATLKRMVLDWIKRTDPSIE